MSNTLFVGFNKTLELPKRGFLYIGDEVPDVPQARVFDPLKHSFNPLKGLDYRKECDIVDSFDVAFPRGDGTLTKDTGLDFIAECLQAKPKSLRQLVPVPAKTASTGHVWAYNKVRRILRSPVLSAALCNAAPPAFSFNTRSVILARINRAELGDFDALVLGLFLIAQFKEQIVLEDGGFYLRELHANLLREGRLIAGVNVLEELPPKLRRLALQQCERFAEGTTYEDAVELAKYDCGFPPGALEYNGFISEAMA